VLGDSKKKELYDMETKANKNNDFFSQRTSFQEFLKLQSNNSNNSNSNNTFDVIQIEKLSNIDIDKKISDLKFQRESEDLELIQEKKFSNKSFDLSSFNKKFDKKISSKSNQITKWESFDNMNNNNNGFNINQFMSLEPEPEQNIEQEQELNSDQNQDQELEQNIRYNENISLMDKVKMFQEEREKDSKIKYNTTNLQLDNIINPNMDNNMLKIKKSVKISQEKLDAYNKLIE
jgi:hypothetical protein